jgi:hypothetical protein
MLKIVYQKWVADKTGFCAFQGFCRKSGENLQGQREKYLKNTGGYDKMIFVAR